MRTLYYVPIIHSQEDYGFLGPKITEQIKRRLGEGFVRDLEKKIGDYWDVVSKRIKEEFQDFSQLVIYQDSLPVGEREKILKLFESMLGDYPESKNFLLIKELLEKGVTLEGLENVNLIKEQLDIYSTAAKESNPYLQQMILATNRRRSDEILEARDKFIAKRIDETLPEDKIGILFVGRQHRVIEKLSQDIEVKTIRVEEEELPLSLRKKR